MCVCQVCVGEDKQRFMKWTDVTNCFSRDRCDTSSVSATRLAHTSAFVLPADIPSAHQFTPTYSFSHVWQHSMRMLPAEEAATHTMARAEFWPQQESRPNPGLVLNGPLRIPCQRTAISVHTVVLITANKLNRLECFIANEPSRHCSVQKRRRRLTTVMIFLQPSDIISVLISICLYLFWIKMWSFPQLWAASIWFELKHHFFIFNRCKLLHSNRDETTCWWWFDTVLLILDYGNSLCLFNKMSWD